MKPDWEDDPSHCQLCFNRYHAALESKEYREHIAAQKLETPINILDLSLAAQQALNDGLASAARGEIQELNKDFSQYIKDDCQNCGLVDVPLQEGYCEGCICKKCKKNAGETGCSMNEMGWCNSCEEKLNPIVLPCGCDTHRFGCLSRPFDPSE